MTSACAQPGLGQQPDDAPRRGGPAVGSLAGLEQQPQAASSVSDVVTLVVEDFGGRIAQSAGRRRSRRRLQASG